MSRWHTGLSKKTATNIGSLKVASCTPEIIVRYFAILKKTFWFGEKSLGKAMHLWNCDETSFNGDKGGAKEITRRGTKSPLVLTRNN